MGMVVVDWEGRQTIKSHRQKADEAEKAEKNTKLTVFYNAKSLFFRIFRVFLGIFGLFLGESWEIGLTGGKYRPRSTFCPDRWAENFFEKSILVPLLLRIWIFNNRLIF